jgi:hypothetical protein
MNPTSTPTRSLMRRGFLAALLSLALAFALAPIASNRSTRKVS